MWIWHFSFIILPRYPLDYLAELAEYILYYSSNQSLLYILFGNFLKFGWNLIIFIKDYRDPPNKTPDLEIIIFSQIWVEALFGKGSCWTLFLKSVRVFCIQNSIFLHDSKINVCFVIWLLFFDRNTPPKQAILISFCLWTCEKLSSVRAFF